MSDVYNIKTKSPYLYSIMPIQNLKTVFYYGILCKNEIIKRNITSVSIAEENIQIRRDKVTIPNGLKLHDYANLYIDFKNPMLCSKKSKNEEICILCISTEILNVPNVVMTDMNAAKSLVKFYDVKNGIDKLDFNRIFKKYWISENNCTYNENKGIKCAEVLIPYFIDKKYINKIIVYSENAKSKVIDSIGRVTDVSINEKCFF